MHNLSPLNSESTISSQMISEDPKAAPKNWSWIMFFVVGIILSGGRQNEEEFGILVRISALALPIISALLFYRLSFYGIADKITVTKKVRIRYAVIGLLLTLLSAFLQGAFLGIDRIISRKQESAQIRVDTSKQIADYKAQFNSLLAKDAALSEAIIEPARTKNDFEKNISTLKERRSLMGSLDQLTSSIFDLMESTFKRVGSNIDVTPARQQMMIVTDARFAFVDASIRLYEAQLNGEKSKNIEKLKSAASLAANQMSIEESKGESLMNEIATKATNIK